MIRAVIKDIVVFLPEQVVTNEELSERMGGSPTAQQIFTNTGIRERRHARSDEFASDLAFGAGQRLLEANPDYKDQIDFIIYCTQSPDYYCPATSCILQHRLGLPQSCGAQDISLGCSGYVMCLASIKGMIEAGMVRNVILFTAETITKVCHPKDKNVCTLFGDSGTATLLCGEESEAGLGPFIFGTDGAGAPNLIVPAGGYRKFRSPETAIERTDDVGNVRSENNLYMNGAEIFRFSLQRVPAAFSALLAKSGLTSDQVDYLVLHQANKFMLDELVRKLKVPREKVVYAMELVGNTSSSTIPIAIEQLRREKKLRTDQRLMLIGFGIGYSWAGCMVTWA